MTNLEKGIDGNNSRNNSATSWNYLLHNEKLHKQLALIVVQQMINGLEYAEYLIKDEFMYPESKYSEDYAYSIEPDLSGLFELFELDTTEKLKAFNDFKKKLVNYFWLSKNYEHAVGKYLADQSYMFIDLLCSFKMHLISKNRGS